MLFRFSETILVQTKQESQKQDNFENHNDTDYISRELGLIVFCFVEESKEMHNKHLMTGAKENSVFWFPEFINVPRGEARAQLFYSLNLLVAVVVIT